MTPQHGTGSSRVLARAAAALAGLLIVFGPAAAAHADTGPLLDPSSSDAMLNILMNEGVDYDTAQDADEALAYADPDATLVISGDEVNTLTPSEIASLATATWGRVIVLTSDPKVLAAFAPGVTAHSGQWRPDTGLEPSCAESDAAAAGPVVSPGATLYYTIAPAGGATASASASPKSGAGSGATASGTASATAAAPSFATDVTGCYGLALYSGDAPTMVTLNDSRTGGDVVLLGNRSFAENRYLAANGNAALALRLFGAHSDLVWLAQKFTEDPNLGSCGGVPCGSGPTDQSGTGNGGGGGGQPTSMPTPQPGGASTQQVQSLLPHWIWWAVLQLAVAAAALAYWRARRMGRLVSEALPVRVRAAETVEGHANLYRRAAAHARAADLLRAAAARRIAPLLGLSASTWGRSPQLLVAPLAERLGRSPEEVHAVLAGDVPETEAELVRLTDQLDRLEQEVRSR